MCIARRGGALARMAEGRRGGGGRKCELEKANCCMACDLVLGEMMKVRWPVCRHVAGRQNGVMINK